MSLARDELIIATAMVLGCELVRTDGPHSNLTYWTALMPNGMPGGVSISRRAICDIYLSQLGFFVDGSCNVIKL